jgi:Ca2+-binding EF-hand superfamily protein
LHPIAIQRVGLALLLWIQFFGLAMGNSNQPLISPTSYGRNLSCIEYLENEFWFTKSDLKQFFQYFNEIHKMNPKYEHLITLTELLIYFHIESNSIHKLIFGWLSKQTNGSTGIVGNSHLTFSFIEFVIILTTFLSLNDNEVSKFLFILFDLNGDGYLEYEEITSLVNLMKSEDNVRLRPFTNILTELMNGQRTSYNSSQFVIFLSKHTALTGPFRQLKCELQTHCFSANYWENKLIQRMKGIRKQSKYANLEQYPLIALEVQELLFLFEKEEGESQPNGSRNDSGDLRKDSGDLRKHNHRYFLNPKYCSWEGREISHQEKLKETSSRRSLPSLICSDGTTRTTTTSNSTIGIIKQGSKRKELRRGTSNDDMLDTTGKLHKQPSATGSSVNGLGSGGAGVGGGRKSSLQHQRTSKQLQVQTIMEVYAGGPVALPRLRRDEEEENGIKTNPSNESSPVSPTSSSKTQQLHNKQPSSTNLLPSVSRRGGGGGSGLSTSPKSSSTASPYAPLTRGSSSKALFQPLVQPKGVIAAAKNRKLLRKYSSDDMLR